MDAVHLPYGCSVCLVIFRPVSCRYPIPSCTKVWPAFWSLGANKEWPNGGEVDIMEGINLMTNNQMALHTTPGCMQTPGEQTGATLETDCSTDQGCLVAEKQPNSYGESFAQAGGGVWAVQFDDSVISMWFWSVSRQLPSPSVSHECL